ncbi:futalosine hydrolase [Streptomyces abyssalis]|uniref:Futalosine hydrolase n=1 Tax=Streptomyces abyssalis TaxID=933944 RepID=A0A1E7JNL9_9ACTN|nr:futalosine hydrolase [Streptomyces abyssalis]OEU86755.1 futalosine hydrolase [Streptomyces abyssalis]OEU89856.1 futalosine hydrolase [Streptomyces abyssalis]
MRRARILVVTAVTAERDAVTSRLERDAAPADVEVVAAGVGPAAAAAATASALTSAAAGGRPFTLAVSTGIAGGFGQPLGGVVVASSIVAADLGAVTPDGFASVADLGFGRAEHHPPPALVRDVAEAADAASGPVLTVSTVTGTQARAQELAARHPGAVAEAMEGFGVAEAAAAQGVPVLELRTVSNPVGPRDRAAWRIPGALAALGTGCAAMLPVLRAWKP